MVQKIKNPAFFVNGNGFNVRKNSCSYIINERFQQPISTSSYKGQKHFEVEVIVNLNCPNRERYLEISSKQLDNAKSSTNEPHELGMGHPFDKVQNWVNSDGETFLAWIKRLASSKLAWPTEKDRNGGISPYATTQEKVWGNVKKETKYRN